MKFLISLALIFLLLNLICASKQSTNDTAKPELKLVQIVHRHGDRTQFGFFPNDKLDKLEYWPDGLGQLTSMGKRRMYKMGLKLRNHYTDFLGSTCNPRSLYIRSSAVDRCIESASALLAGLCPPSNRWVWYDGLDSSQNLAQIWQPIAIQTVDKSLDSILFSEAYCPAADEERLKVFRSKEVQEKLNNSKEFIDKIAKFTGNKNLNNESLTTFNQLLYIADTFKCEIENGKYENVKKLENEFGKNNDILEQLYELAIQAFNYYFKTPKLQRLRAGPLLGELVKNMENVMNSKEARKLFIYSTHDITIISLMKALQVYNDNLVKYGEGLMFELYHVNSIPEYYVNISYIAHDYDTDMNPKFRHIQLPNCTDHLTCTWSQFNRSISDLIPNQWNEECKNKKFIIN